MVMARMPRLSKSLWIVLACFLLTSLPSSQVGWSLITLLLDLRTKKKKEFSSAFFSVLCWGGEVVHSTLLLPMGWSVLLLRKIILFLLTCFSSSSKRFFCSLSLSLPPSIFREEYCIVSYGIFTVMGWSLLLL